MTGESRTLIDLWECRGGLMQRCSDPTANANGASALVAYVIWCHAFTKGPKQPLSILHEPDVGLT